MHIPYAYAEDLRVNYVVDLLNCMRRIDSVRPRGWFLTEAEEFHFDFGRGRGQPEEWFFDRGRGRGVVILTEAEDFFNFFLKNILHFKYVFFSTKIEKRHF